MNYSELLLSVLPSIITVALFGLIGYIVFRTDQKNKNMALETRMNSIEKDITKNDQRIRKDVEEQIARDDRRMSKIEHDIEGITGKLNETAQSSSETRVTVGHIEKLALDMSKKLDIVLRSVIPQRRAEDE